MLEEAFSFSLGVVFLTWLSAFVVDLAVKTISLWDRNNHQGEEVKNQKKKIRAIRFVLNRRRFLACFLERVFRLGMCMYVCVAHARSRIPWRWGWMLDYCHVMLVARDGIALRLLFVDIR